MRALPPWLVMGLAAVSWGAATVLSKVSVQQLTGIDLLGIEVTVGAAALWGIVLVRGGPVRAWARPSLVVLGVLEPGLSFALFDQGIVHTGALDGGLLLASETLFTVALAVLLLRERVGPRLLAALVAGALGATLVAVRGGGMTSVLGDSLVLGASLAAAAYAVGARRWSQQADAVAVTAVQLLAAWVLVAPLAGGVALAGHSHISRTDTPHLVAAVATGILATALPFVLFSAAITRLQASQAALILALIPIFAAVIAVVGLGEPVGVAQALGGTLVVGAAAVAARADEAPLV